MFLVFLAWQWSICTEIVIGISRAWIGLLAIDTGLVALMIMKASEKRKWGIGRILSILLHDGM